MREKNGNPAAQFDVNKLTEFRVTICACQESGTIKLGSSLPGNVSGKSLGEDAVSGARNAGTKSGSGTIKPESGTINCAQLYNTDSQDRAVLQVVSQNPGIKKDAIFLKVRMSTRSVQWSLERLCSDKKIEYRGSKKTGGWYVCLWFRRRRGLSVPSKLTVARRGGILRPVRTTGGWFMPTISVFYGISIRCSSSPRNTIPRTSMRCMASMWASSTSRQRR